jgi:VCBS repeat-containing protein
VANSVLETAATGTAVGITVRAVDPDTGAGVTYRLTSDAGGRFAIDTVTGVVSTAAALDHEAAASHAITVLATSSDGSTSSQTFTIAVTDANEAPVFAVPSRHVAVRENTLASVTLLTSTATDGDTGDTRTHSLSGADAALFNINAATGAVTFKGSSNLEMPLAASGTSPTSFNGVATDAAGLTDLHAG